MGAHHFTPGSCWEGQVTWIFEDRLCTDPIVRTKVLESTAAMTRFIFKENRQWDIYWSVYSLIPYDDDVTFVLHSNDIVDPEVGLKAVWYRFTPIPGFLYPET